MTAPKGGGTVGILRNMPANAWAIWLEVQGWTNFATF
jgi:hypothetical protein